MIYPLINTKRHKQQCSYLCSICFLNYSFFSSLLPSFISLFVHLLIHSFIYILFCQLEKKSVLDTEVEAKAFLEVMGKKIHSEGYREPEAD